jgi:hypothetical protein
MTLCLSFLCRKTHIYVFPGSEVVRFHVVALVAKIVDENEMAVLFCRRLGAYKLAQISPSFFSFLSTLQICEYL